MTRWLALALALTTFGCGPSRMVAQSPVAAPTDETSRTTPGAVSGAVPPLVFTEPLAPTFDPVASDADSAPPSAAFTGGYVKNELDAAWHDGAPTETSVVPLAEKDGLTPAQVSLLVVTAPAKLRAMGVDAKHCRLDRESGPRLVVTCAEGALVSHCVDRMRTVRLRVGEQTLEVLEDVVRTGRIDRANGSCGCYGLRDDAAPRGELHARG